MYLYTVLIHVLCNCLLQREGAEVRGKEYSYSDLSRGTGEEDTTEGVRTYVRTCVCACTLAMYKCT